VLLELAPDGTVKIENAPADKNPSVKTLARGLTPTDIDTGLQDLVKKRMVESQRVSN
jgi:hypothetical protein